MANIDLGIPNWLHQQREWLQEAVERLLASDSLEDSDIQAIAERLKSTDGQQLTTHRTFDGIGSAAESRT